MFLVIDNYDSFVYNLARYVALAGQDYKVVRNDALTLEEIEALKPEAILLSPGPGRPTEAGICVDLIKRFGPSLPILGVCLGHQAVGEAYGGKTLQAQTPVHGKSCAITHRSTDLFEDIPSPMTGGRYHSLITKLTASSPLMVTAQNESKEIMAIRHDTHPVYGVQFHPESVLTDHGLTLIRNFSRIATAWNRTQHQPQNRIVNRA